MDMPGFKLDMGALMDTKAPESGTEYEMLVLGGGPAAMNAAIYAARKMVKLAVLTKDFGGQMLETSEVENWLGYQTVDAKDLASQFEEHVKSFEIPVSLGPSIKKVEKEGDVFKVTTDDGKTYKGKTIVYALGMHHRSLGVPGENTFSGKGVAYCATCDAPFYKKKKVVVVGGGNSAFTTALDLSKVEATITVINFVKGWDADGSLVKRVKHYDLAELLDYHQVLEIKGKEKVGSVLIKDRETEQRREIEADGVFVEIGLQTNIGPVKDLVNMNQQGEIEVDCSCRTNVKGFFAAGDVTTVPYKQIVIAAGEGAKAALAAHQYLVSEELV